MTESGRSSLRVPPRYRRRCSMSMPLTKASRQAPSSTSARSPHSSDFFSVGDFHRCWPPSALSPGTRPGASVASRAAIEKDVFDQLTKVRRNLFVHFQHAGIDDAHVHAGLDGVVEKRRVHRFAHVVVAAEAEGDIRYAAADLGMRQVRLDPAGGLDEVDRVVVVLLDPGGDRENVGVEDDEVLPEESRSRRPRCGRRARRCESFRRMWRLGPFRRRPSQRPLPRIA